MRKFLTVIFSVLFISSAFSQKRMSFTGWSLTAEAGMNYFDGDIPQELTQVFPSSVRTISSGGTIEYALTPIWGLSLDFYFFPLRAPLGSDKTINNVNTNLITSDINATVNFTRLIFPETKTKIYFIGSVGLGFARYDFNVLDKDGIPIPANAIETNPNTNADRTVLIHSGKVPLKTGQAGSVPVTMAIEYNFSKFIALGTRFHYRAHTKDNLEGVTRLNWDGVTNDFIAAGQVYLRYKVNTALKSHKRNIRMEEYMPNSALELARENTARINRLDTVLIKLEQKVDIQIVRIDSIASLLCDEGPDTDEDCVPDCRDKEPNTPPNSMVDFWGRKITCLPAYPIGVVTTNTNVVEVPGVNTNIGSGSTVVTAPGVSTAPITYIDDIPAVYFDFDQIELDDDALVTIRKVSARMKANPGLMVEVRGYCDNMGTNPYNNLLSQRRADRVKIEMVKMWGIAPERIFTNGKGKIQEPLSRYRPNRRCDFFFSK